MRALIAAFALLLSVVVPSSAQTRTVPDRSIGISRGHFMLDGQPFQIISGEMHYARIPRQYWRDRLRKARAMGLNTISTYVFWNLHEPKPGVYDFRGRLDVAEFIREAQQQGLYVIVRLGPYVCTEWDLGGFPSWLLARPDAALRSTDEGFLGPVKVWMSRLGRQLAPLQITRGGPIIAVQVENEYGSFGSDHTYMSRIRDIIRHAGFDGVILYTADGAPELSRGSLPGLPAAVNFGPGEARTAFTALRSFRPQGPFMNGEYWDGWFDHWGETHHTTGLKQQVDDLSWMLSQGYSVNLYVFEGGTSFGFMSGANFGTAYEPDTTSYDYDAPLDEAGRPTKKFFAFRDVILRHLHNANLPPRLRPIPVIAIEKFRLEDSASLWRHLGRSVFSQRPQTMEAQGQSYGFILYRTQMKGPTGGDLLITKVHDYAEVFLNQKLVGTLDRRLKQDHLLLHLPPGEDTLDILVENSGRINYGPKLRNDRKGITHRVSFAGKELTGWRIFPLPMLDPRSIHFAHRPSRGPAFHRGTFNLREVGDTFLDMGDWGKGVVWVNGHNLGRFWNIGPQQTLYLPGAWLHVGKNQVIVFDLRADSAPSLEGLRNPILNDLRTNPRIRTSERRAIAQQVPARKELP